jgi:hypothetical protein
MLDRDAIALSSRAFDYAKDRWENLSFVEQFDLMEKFGNKAIVVSLFQYEYADALVKASDLPTGVLKDEN